MYLLLAAIPVMVWDLAISDHSFVSSGSTAQWEWGVPLLGPEGNHPMWGTELGGFYLNDTTDFLEVPIPSLAGIDMPVLSIRHWYALQAEDVGNFQVFTNSNWVDVEPIYGYPGTSGFLDSSGGWVTSNVDLSGYGDNAGFRFVFYANDSVADVGWYTDYVALFDGDISPPRITPNVLPEDTQQFDGPYTVSAVIIDDIGIAEATLSYQVNEGSTQVVNLELGLGGFYSGEIPAQAPGTEVFWSLWASDGSQSTVWPIEGLESFRVFLAPVESFTVDVGERSVQNIVQFQWSPPASSHEVLAYELTEQDGRIVHILGGATKAEVNLYPYTSQIWEIEPVYSHGFGDPSDPLYLDIEVPYILNLDPPAVPPGANFYLTGLGESLYLLDGVTVLELGEGIDVQSVEVLDVNRFRALVYADTDAEPGIRTLTVTSPHGHYVFPEVFAVSNEAPISAELSMTPESGVQGEVVEAILYGNFDPSASPAIITDGDLILLSDPVVDEETVTVPMQIKSNAHVGIHTITVDDGAHYWVVEFNVIEYVIPPQAVCASAPKGTFQGLILLMMGLALIRRTAKDLASADE